MRVLEARDVTKSYRDGRDAIQALKGASLSVEAGEVVILNGPSGSGKTTFLSIAGCILAPTSGQVMVNGTSVTSLGGRDLARIRRHAIGFVFQHFNLFPALTVLENVQFALNMKGVRNRAARIEAEELVIAVGLEDKRHALPRDLSGGQKQLVAIARALCGNPALILADEPTSSLDSEIGGRVMAMFRDLATRRDKGLLIVTHDPALHAIADRVVEIRDGRIVAESKEEPL